MRDGVATLSLALAVCALFLPPAAARADTFLVLHAFLDGNDGATPNTPVILDAKGNIYGTALQGGTTNDGVVFKISAKGKESILYSFAAGNDGRRPEAGLVRDKNGNLYGTTNQGGSADQGTVFKLAPDGTESVLHTFTGGSDGGFPQANLIIDKQGNLYGTATQGGSGCDIGCGTIFEVAADGSFTTLHAFAGASDGEYPMSWLVADAKGNLYGTAAAGGAHGFGTVFRLSARGTLKVLYAFQGGTDGGGSQAGLIRDSAGNLYGTTRNGGGTGCGTGGCGTIFKLSPGGSETVLYAFSGGSDGAEPYGGVVADVSGNLYGTTIAGGSQQGLGVVFELLSGGSLKVLHTFEGANDGAWPEAGVALDGTGSIYGTSYAEGPDGWGTVFKISE